MILSYLIPWFINPFYNFFPLNVSTLIFITHLCLILFLKTWFIPISSCWNKGVQCSGMKCTKFFYSFLMQKSSNFFKYKHKKTMILYIVSNQSFTHVLGKAGSLSLTAQPGLINKDGKSRQRVSDGERFADAF